MKKELYFMSGKRKNMKMTHEKEKCRVCGAIKQTDIATGLAMRKLRVEAGIRQMTLAKALSVHAPYICDLENGKRRWSQKWIARYEAAVEKITNKQTKNTQCQQS